VSAERFAHPEWGPALVALVLVAGLLLWRAARVARRRLRVLLAGLAPRLDLAPDAALFAALVAIAIALAGPRIGERSERVSSSGVDLVVLVDVSQSMEARDVAPSRLERARRAAHEVLARLLAGDRAALAAFAGRGVLLTPLTPDLDALQDLLPALDTELMQSRGSRLAEGVRAALPAFEAGSERPRVLLVLSDGEDPLRAAGQEEALAEAARAGVRVLAAAFGQASGATVPDRGAPLRDFDGRIVVSRPDPVRLGALARGAGGALLATDAWGVLDADAAVREVRRDAPGAPGETRERRVPAVRVAPFAALAFLALALELARPRRPAWLRIRRRRAPSPGRVGGMPSLARTALLALALLLAAREASPEDTPDPEAPPLAPSVPEAESRVRERPGDPARLLELGLARAAAGDHEGASHAFGAAALYARDPSVAALGYYDLGVAALAQGRLPEARDAFFDALALAPGDRRARFNLEWTLRALAAQLPPKGGEREGQGEPGGEPEEQERGAREPGPGEPGAPEAKPSEAREPGAEGAEGKRAEGAAPPTGGEQRSDPRGDPRPGGPREGQAGEATPGGDPVPARPGAPPELSPDEAARWLAGVADDPTRAARQLARRAAGEPRPAPAGEPTW
jgi:Ca-activated chloride channel family protein